MNVNACSIKPRCVVGLFASPLLGGTLFGLRPKGGELELDLKAFACCEGLGLLYDQSVNATTRCSIQRNLRAVRLVYRRFAETLGRDLYDYELRAINTQLTPFLHAVLKNFGERTLPAFATPGKAEKQPLQPPFWVLALAGAWRYGMGVTVANLAKSVPNDLAQLVASKERIQLVAVTGLHRLNDPGYADAFEGLVSYAYHSETPLLLDGAGLSRSPVKEKPESPVAGFGTKGIFKQRAAELKRRHPLHFVQRDCLSRLQNMLGAEASSVFEGL